MTTTLTQELGSPATTGSLAIEARGLAKAFGTTRALDGLDLSVPSGSVYAILGPNGAGKTTAIRIFATLTRPDAGTARVLGHDVTADPHAVRSGICLAGQLATVDEADYLADRIAVIDHGDIVAEGTPGELKASTGSGVLRIRLADARDAGRAREILDRVLGVHAIQDQDPAALSARIAGRPGRPGDPEAPQATEVVAGGIAQLAREGIGVSGFALGQPSLDEVFLALTEAAP